MNTANILGSHLNPQQVKLFTSSPQRKRWIWSHQDDHLQLLAARTATDALAGQPVVIWYDDASAVDDMLNQFPLYQIEKAIYHQGRHSALENALHLQPTEQGIHHIEMY